MGSLGVTQANKSRFFSPQFFFFTFFFPWATPGPSASDHYSRILLTCVLYIQQSNIVCFRVVLGDWFHDHGAPDLLLQPFPE